MALAYDPGPVSAGNPEVTRFLEKFDGLLANVTSVIVAAESTVRLAPAAHQVA